MHHNLDGIIERSLEAVQGLADAENVVLDAEGTDPRAWCDEDKIVQVLVNLLSNAIKCSP
ncbi:MAG: hypothetical protein K2X93_16685 [Candidatus Obscuribacterales bacterium]|nr:hypothetical protein [Candidatus Obscuribacterales bacterium]